MDLSGDPAAVKVEVLRRVPIGTPIHEAEDEMHSLGLDCSYGNAIEHRYRITRSGTFLHPNVIDVVITFDRLGRTSTVEVEQILPKDG
jgi:hypothetical protein